MQTITYPSLDTARAIGELCVGGDWACAHGDLPTLGSIAYQLAVYSQEPLHCELAQLADLCRRDEPRATTVWASVKDRLYRSTS
jgi:hypothetical protein